MAGNGGSAAETPSGIKARGNNRQKTSARAILTTIVCIFIREPPKERTSQRPVADHASSWSANLFGPPAVPRGLLLDKSGAFTKTAPSSSPSQPLNRSQCRSPRKTNARRVQQAVVGPKLISLAVRRGAKFPKFLPSPWSAGIGKRQFPVRPALRGFDRTRQPHEKSRSHHQTVQT